MQATYHPCSRRFTGGRNRARSAGAGVEASDAEFQQIYLLNGPRQSVIGKPEYLHLFTAYVHSHRLTLPSGEVIPWVDEALDPDSGEWGMRRLLTERKSPLEGRGAYYNHSRFADPLVTGLVGLRPQAENEVVLNPLLPPGTWTYFALDALPYHGHILTILYDRDGSGYRFAMGSAR